MLPASQVAAAVDSATAASASAEAEANPPPTSSASASSSAEPPSPWLTISAPSLKANRSALRSLRMASRRTCWGVATSRTSSRFSLAATVARSSSLAISASAQHPIRRTPDTTTGALPQWFHRPIFRSIHPAWLASRCSPPKAGVFVTDEDGRLMSSSRPPATGYGLRVGVVGTRALAVDNQIVYETLDGGLNWHTLPAIGALRPRAEIRSRITTTTTNPSHPSSVVARGVSWATSSVASVGETATSDTHRAESNAPSYVNE